MPILVGVVLVFSVIFRLVATTKTKVFDSLCMTQETQCALLGYALATDDDCLRAEFLEHAQALQELIDEGQDLWEETRLAGRARLTRHGANGNDLKIAAANGYVPWFDAVLEGGRASEGAYLAFLGATYPMFDHMCALAAMTPVGKKCDPLAPRPEGGRHRKLNYRQMCAYGLHELTSHDTSATMAYLFGIHPGTTSRCGLNAQILLNDVFHLWEKSWAIVPSMLAQDMLSHLLRDHTGGESRLSDAVFATTKNIWAIDGYPVPTKRSGNRFIQSAHFQTKAGYHCTLGIELFSVTGCTDAYVTNIPGRFSELAESEPIFDILRDKTVTIPHAKAYADSLFRVKDLQEFTSSVPKAVEKIASWDKGNLAVTKEKAKNTMEHRFWAGWSLLTIYIP
jgi:hypothetical protein